MADKFFITGGAGFIGFHLGKKLLEQGHEVLVMDCMNDYYDVSLKEARLNILRGYEQFQFIKADIADRSKLEECFQNYQPDYVVNLAAQAGVRYSIDHPEAYIHSNIIGFFHVLECLRNYPVKQFLYASSSSVYGMNQKVPYSTEDKTDQPVSLYAATKKSNELMAYTYSHLYGIPAVGLRFFTVYGPFGRPDMAYFSFTDKILKGETIPIFNQGDLYRDFTYIDDIINGITNIIGKLPDADKLGVRHKVYNIGNSHPEKLMDFIEILEKCIGVQARKEYLPMQAGDVYQTYADVRDLVKDFGFKPDTALKSGLTKFIRWYREYYSIME